MTTPWQHKKDEQLKAAEQKAPAAATPKKTKKKAKKKAG